MKSFFLSLSLLFVCGFAMATGVEPVAKKINLTSSKINWKGYKVTGSHEGDIKFKSGELKFEKDVLVGGELVVDMNSMNCTDLAATSGKGNLEGHLKSDDFFGVAAHPTATIKITKVASRGKAGEYKVTANLTIKNTTKEIKFNANVSNGTGTAAVKIDRTDYNVKYGSGSFFDSLGDKTIYDEFDLDIMLNF